MAFYLYKKEQREVQNIPRGWFEQVEQVKLAGKNFKKLRKQHGEPLDQGWHITRDDLTGILTNGNGNSNSNSVIIDWNPKTDLGVDLVEILDIYVYTYTN